MTFLWIFLLLGKVDAGEWLTAGGDFCIDKCRYDGKEHFYYWCHTSDPSLYYSDGQNYWWWSKSKVGPDTRLKWDYCVPSEIPPSPFYNPSTVKPPYNKGNLPPANTDFNSHELIYGNQTNSKGPTTALYPPVTCSGECVPSGRRTTCNVVGSHPAAEGDINRRWFYCVDERPHRKIQLSAINGFWCMDDCRKEGDDHFWCHTLYGRDHCSPSPNVGSLGSRCRYPCEKYSSWTGDYSFCYVDVQNKTWEYCGNYTIPESKKSIVEFTRYDAVCADFCRWDDSKTYEFCYYVYWIYNSTENESSLHKSWDYCRGYHPESLSAVAIVFIILGSIGGVFLCAVFAWWATK